MWALQGLWAARVPVMGLSADPWPNPALWSLFLRLPPPAPRPHGVSPNGKCMPVFSLAVSVLSTGGRWGSSEVLDSEQEAGLCCLPAM